MDVKQTAVEAIVKRQPEGMGSGERKAIRRDEVEAPTGNRVQKMNACEPRAERKQSRVRNEGAVNFL